MFLWLHMLSWALINYFSVSFRWDNYKNIFLKDACSRLYVKHWRQNILKLAVPSFWGHGHSPNDLYYMYKEVCSGGKSLVLSWKVFYIYRLIRITSHKLFLCSGTKHTCFISDVKLMLGDISMLITLNIWIPLLLFQVPVPYFLKWTMSYTHKFKTASHPTQYICILDHGQTHTEMKDLHGDFVWPVLILVDCITIGKTTWWEYILKSF